MKYGTKYKGERDFLMSVHLYAPMGKTHFGTKDKDLIKPREKFTKKDEQVMQKLMFGPIDRFVDKVNEKVKQLKARGKLKGVNAKKLMAKIDVGEFSISRFTENQYGWFKAMYHYMETNPNITSWTKHALNEADIWNHPAGEPAGQLTSAILDKGRSRPAGRAVRGR